MEIFKSEEFGKLRTVEVNGDFYFIAKDIAAALGYKDTSDAVKRHVDADDKLSRRITDSGQGRQMHVINESGLYSLILSSKLPAAKRFKKWVTSDVLPTLRKHGMYATDELLSDPDLLIQVATELKKERSARMELEKNINSKNEVIKNLLPKAKYLDMILKSSSLITTTAIAKDYGYSARSFNALLNDLGIQYKQTKQWFLYAKYHKEGYTHSSTQEIKLKSGGVKVVTHTKWTQKGRLFLYDKLKECEILPVIESGDKENGCF